MRRNIEVLQRAMWVAFGLVGLALVYWQVLRAGALATRSDNPRRVIAEQRVRRGKILTADGVALAETLSTPDGLARRHYPYPNLATVTGYYSLRYGTGGLEAAFDERLRGEARQTWLDRAMHRPPVGQNITVTVRLAAQVAADAALAEAGVSGAALVLDARSGAVRVMASRPTFDPNTLDAKWDALSGDPDAPLLNRATQGLFPLGELAYLVGWMGLLERDLSPPADPLHTPLPVLLAPLGGEGVAAVARQLGFVDEIPFSLPTTAGFLPSQLPGKAEEIAVTPLHLARVGAALAAAGLAPTPTLLLAPAEPSPPATPLLKPETARRIATRQTEFIALAPPDVTGNVPVSWYLGWTDGDSPQVVVVVVAGAGVDRETAAGIGRRLNPLAMDD
ncbi:MAG: hypothetical protein D6796_02230 [Caldilineae bacterium]|nr:MAG: hypothetical protein D6796_02230 [Caldilineae bacterium]